jgi:hypothetical protein
MDSSSGWIPEILGHKKGEVFTSPISMKKKQ